MAMDSVLTEKKCQIIKSKFLKSSTFNNNVLHIYPQVLILGRSNVGKSSVVNMLFNKKRLAFISKSPGNTYLINIFYAELFKINNKINKKFYLIDVPGFGYSVYFNKRILNYCSKIAKYLISNKYMYNIFYLVDVRRTLKIEDLSFIKKLIKYSNNYLLILTKVDKIPKYQRIPILKKFSKKLNIEENNIILCSAIQHIGFYKIIEYLWKIILQQ